MSNLYKTADDVPNKVLCQRLKELSCAIANGRESLLREFDMRVPAELDRDADLVLSIASERIRKLEKVVKVLGNVCDRVHQKKFIVQPLISIWKEYGELIEMCREKEN